MSAPEDTLIVVKDNSYGLTRDAALLASALARAGVRTRLVGHNRRGTIDRLIGRRRAARAIHIERAFPAWYSAAEENWLIPNQERFPQRHRGRLAGIDLVLAKTRHAEAVFGALGVPTAHLGFTSVDRLNADIRRDWNAFYHLAGASTLKGTEDLLALWARHPEWPELHLVQKAENAPKRVPDNVRLRAGYLTDDELSALQNRFGLHLCPSRSEGWGHHILEAMSCAGVVITTDAPPMNEHVDSQCGVLVPWSRAEPRHLGTSYFVDPLALENAIEGLLRMPQNEKIALGKAARSAFNEIDAGFHRRLAERLATSPGAAA